MSEFKSHVCLSIGDVINLNHGGGGQGRERSIEPYILHSEVHFRFLFMIIAKLLLSLSFSLRRRYIAETLTTRSNKKATNPV